jgi:hypothetical protein
VSLTIRLPFRRRGNILQRLLLYHRQLLAVADNLGSPLLSSPALWSLTLLWLPVSEWLTSPLNTPARTLALFTSSDTFTMRVSHRVPGPLPTIIPFYFRLVGLWLITRIHRLALHHATPARLARFPRWLVSLRHPPCDLCRHLHDHHWLARWCPRKSVQRWRALQVGMVRRLLRFLPCHLVCPCCWRHEG